MGETFGLRAPPLFVAVVMDSDEVAVVVPVPWLLWPVKNELIPIHTFTFTCTCMYMHMYMHNFVRLFSSSRTLVAATYGRGPAHPVGAGIDARANRVQRGRREGQAVRRRLDLGTTGVGEGADVLEGGRERV